MTPTLKPSSDPQPEPTGAVGTAGCTSVGLLGTQRYRGRQRGSEEDACTSLQAGFIQYRQSEAPAEWKKMSHAQDLDQTPPSG